jgi:hypothetical protein
VRELAAYVNANLGRLHIRAGLLACLPVSSSPLSQKRDTEMSPSETGHCNLTSAANFRIRRRGPYARNAAIERDPIPYALETVWPVGAGGFEPLHL